MSTGKTFKPANIDRHRSIAKELKVYADTYELACEAAKAGRGVYSSTSRVGVSRLARLMALCRELSAECVE
jgi:hypothetical protein